MKTTTTGALRFMSLDVYRVAREMVERVGALGVRNPALRDQLTRACTSVLLNLAEGLPSRSAAMRAKFFATAQGSAYEVAAGVDAARALRAIDEADAAAIFALCDRVSAMLHRMR